MDRRIVEYAVIRKVSATDLVNSMAEYIHKGWEPLGGISVTQIGNGLEGFTQAIVKYAEPWARNHD